MEKAPIPVDKLKKEYSEKTIYPIKKNIFRAFRRTDYQSVNVVILGQDPYPGVYKGTPSACGLAFATENGYTNPSVRIILEELQRSIPNSLTDSPIDLFRWTNQGVLLLNTALTVEAGKPKSHSLMWKPFTEYVITKLAKEKMHVVWLLMGKEAQKYESLIFAGSVIKVPHPAAEIYSGKKAGFIGSDCFNKINEALFLRHSKQIKW